MWPSINCAQPSTQSKEREERLFTLFFIFFFFFEKRDVYNERFPELASLVLDNLEYIKTVMVIGNETDITKVCFLLFWFFTGRASFFSLSVFLPYALDSKLG